MANITPYDLIYFVITFSSLALCAWIPVKISANPVVRRWVYWLVLVPIILVVIFYVYPMGIDLFRRMALTPS